MHGVHVTVQFGDRYELSPTISRAKIEIVRLLIEKGLDVTAKDKSLSTPLHLASSLGIPEIVQLLIERGADITATDASRRTPLHIASSFVGAKVVSLLFCLTGLMYMDRITASICRPFRSPTLRPTL
jgi:ankyrin repeat protein